MAVRFELSELDDVPAFLELVEEAGTTAFVTIGGRDRFAVVPAERYAAVQAGALRAERELAEARGRLAALEAQQAEGPVVAPTPSMASAASDDGACDAGAAQGARAIEPASPSAAGAEPAGEEGIAAQNVAAGDAGSAPEEGAPAHPARSSEPPACEPYEVAELPLTPIDSEDYQRSMWHDAIVERMRKVMEAEAPIERQRLFNTVRASFGIKRSGRDIQAQNEWLFGRNVECATTEFNGQTFVWRPDQDPQRWNAFRVSSEDADRQIAEVPYEELACAMAAALADGAALSRDELIEATMRLLGYRRKTTRVREVVGAAIERAAQERAIRLFSDGTFRSARA